MTMSEVGRRDQLVDPVNGGDVAADGTLLSVAEIQQRFREERARRGLAAAPCTAPTPQVVTTSPGEPAPAAPPAPPATPAAGIARPARPAAPTVTAPVAGGLELPAAWVRVLAGHSGAGASTVALAIADAAASAGRRSLLIETAPASRSGLVSAASRELDVDATGAWRRGTRPHPTTGVEVTIDRRTEDRHPTAWPATDAAAPGELLVTVDLGMVAGDSLSRAVGGPIVVACRATIPGVRLAEQLLHRLDGAPVVVALLLRGRRWPGGVTSSCGPRLTALRAAGLVVTVPVDDHLTITGPTHAALPKGVLAAGRELLLLLDSAREGAASPTAHAALRSPQKGTSR